MVHLSVAVGRFFEALFYAMLQAAGLVAVGMVLAAIGLVLLFRVFRKRRPKA